MSDTPTAVSIDYVLASTKNRLHISDSSEDEYLTQIIIDGISETNCFHIDISGTQTKILDVSAINTVDLPVDYMDWVRIGIIIGNKIISLTVNEKIITPTEELCGLEINDYPLSEGITPFFHYGAGGTGTQTQFKIDKRGRRIILNNTLPSNKLYIEYMSSGVSENTIIPYDAVPMLRAYAIWCRTESDKESPAVEKERKAKLYVQETRRLKEKETRVTVDEIMDGLYSGYRQTIKR